MRKHYEILANRKKKLTKRNREYKMNKQPTAVVPCTNRIRSPENFIIVYNHRTPFTQSANEELLEFQSARSAEGRWRRQRRRRHR